MTRDGWTDWHSRWEIFQSQTLNTDRPGLESLVHSQLAEWRAASDLHDLLCETGTPTSQGCTERWHHVHKALSEGWTLHSSCWPGGTQLQKKSSAAENNLKNTFLNAIVLYFMFHKISSAHNWYVPVCICMTWYQEPSIPRRRKQKSTAPEVKRPGFCSGLLPSGETVRCSSSPVGLRLPHWDSA